MRSILPSMLLFACASESILEKQENAAPSILIISHGDGAELLEGFSEQFRATVSDENHEYDELQVAWYVGEELICDWAEASLAGESSCEVALTPADNNIIAEVRDPQGAGGRSELSLSVLDTEAPVVEILAPLMNGSYYADQLIEFSALVSDNEDLASELQITWTSSIDGELPLNTDPDSSGEIEDYTSLSEGQHAIELRVEDSTTKVTTESVVIDVGGDNNDPLCEIIEPSGGTAFVSGQNISFSGVANDEDINNSLLLIRWESNQDGIFDTTIANTAGELGFVHDGLSIGNHTIILHVEDEVGGLCTDSTLLAVGTPPTLNLTAPVDGEVLSLGTSVSFVASVSDQEDISSDIALSWNSDIDGEFSTQGADSSGNIAFSTFGLSAGMHTISVLATDSAGLTASTTLAIRINTPPPSAMIVLSPDPITSSQNLNALVSSASDADGDNISFSYEWYEDAILSSSLTGSSVAASHLDVGEIWTARVTPNDGYVDGSYTEESITIANSDPMINSVSISPNTAIYNDSVLNCSATASDADETVSPTYQWTVGSTGYSGATLNLAITTAMPGDSITCTANVSDSNGGSDSASTSILVENRVPSITSINISPSIAYSDSILSCSAIAIDPDGEILSPSYEWYSGTGSIGTGDSLTLSSVIVQPGDIVTCTATISDAAGSTGSDSDQITIDNSSPIVNSVTISPDPAYNDDTLNCNEIASDIDNQPLTSIYVWTNSSTGIVLGYSQSITLNSTDASVGDNIVCDVIVSDSSGATGTANAAVILENRAPISPSLSLSPNPAFSTSSIICVIIGSSDPDDDSLNHSYAWSVDGNSVAETSNTLTSGFSMGSIVTCFVTASDASTNGPPGSVSITISNSMPTVDSISLSPDPFYTDSILTAYATASDPEGDSLTLEYSWSVNSTPVQAGSGNTLDSSYFNKTDTVSVAATASDAGGSSLPLSTTLICQNTAPTAPTINLSPPLPIEQVDDLVCSIVTNSSDLDGDSVSYTFSWTVNGSIFSSAINNLTSSMVAYNQTSVGELWECTATPSDGINNGTSASQLVTIDTEVLSGSQTFIYTGSIQNFTVPLGVTAIDIEAYGAEGGTGIFGIGGLGGHVLVTSIAVQSGSTYEVLVGGAGADGNGGTGGWNGGGTGGGGSSCGNYGGGGGGGASDVRITGGGFNDRVVVAGGGGGGGADGMNSNPLYGGDGGGLSGDAGQTSLGWDGQVGTSSNASGTGGTQSGGGSPGIWASSACNAVSGSFGAGGNGNTATGCGGCSGGGGGGAGWYGGGGGGHGGGGGGSGYAISTSGSTSQLNGVQSGNGEVTISW